MSESINQTIQGINTNLPSVANNIAAGFAAKVAGSLPRVEYREEVILRNLVMLQENGAAFDCAKAYNLAVNRFRHV